MESIKKNRPFFKSSNNTSLMMKRLLLSLIPIVLFSFYKNGIIPYINNKTDIFGLLYPLIFIVTSSLFCTLLEYVYYKFIKRNKNTSDIVKNSYPYITGLILSLILPINTPILVLLIGCVIAIFIGKIIYGGFGKNIFNPALIGAIFILTMYGTYINSMGGYLNSYEDTITSATPLSNYKSIEGIGDYDSLVKPYGNLNNFIFGFIPGTIGETSFILCLIAFIYLSCKKVIKWKIPVLYILTVFLMSYIIGGVNSLGIWYPVFSITTGGLMFGAVFMATDPVTSPVTTLGQVLYGIFLGILTVIFRHLTNNPEGVMISILTLNMFVPILDKIGSKDKISIKKIGIPFIISFVFIFIISIMIGNTYKNPTNNNNFNVISVENNIYTVSQKGRGGLIKAEITFDGDDIKNIKVIEHNETASYYKLIENKDYINTLIKNKNNIDNIDAVSGATISSNALKDMVKNTIDYRKEQIS